jgi:hypothetical protein
MEHGAWKMGIEQNRRGPSLVLFIVPRPFFAKGTGLRAQGSVLMAQGTGHRAQGTGLRAQGIEHRAWSMELVAECFSKSVLFRSKILVFEKCIEAT